MSRFSGYEAGTNSNKIHIPLPRKAETMKDLVNYAGKEIARALREYPEKVHGCKRWVTTGIIDLRPDGSAVYFVSYDMRVGYEG